MVYAASEHEFKMSVPGRKRASEPSPLADQAITDRA
jgi:hypothetical protein